MHSFIDAIFRVLSLQSVIQILVGLDNTLPAWNPAEIAAPAGWVRECWMDVACLRTMGLVLQMKADENSPLTPEQRLQAINVYNKCESLSTRLRSHFKGIHGSHVQHAKVAWDEITTLGEEFNTTTCATGLEKMKDYKQLLQTLDDSNKSEHPEHSYNALADLVETADFPGFVRAYGTSCSLDHFGQHPDAEVEESSES